MDVNVKILLQFNMCYVSCVLHVYNVVRAEHVSVSLYRSNVLVAGSVIIRYKEVKPSPNISTNLKLPRYKPWGMLRGILKASHM